MGLKMTRRGMVRAPPNRMRCLLEIRLGSARSLWSAIWRVGWLAAMVQACGSAISTPGVPRAVASKPGLPCAPDNGGLSLPPGFCATVFANGIGHARHLVVSAQGVVYVNTWSGRYYGNDRPPPGGFLVALRDTKGEGV